MGDPRKNQTSQLLLNTKMVIKAEIMLLKRKCKKCREFKLLGKSSDHCHCCQWTPPSDLIDFMRGGQPYQRYQLELKVQVEEEQRKEALKEILIQEDEKKKKVDMMKFFFWENEQ